MQATTQDELFQQLNQDAQVFSEGTRGFIFDNHEAQSAQCFSHDDRQQNPVFNYIKQADLLNNERLGKTHDAIQFSHPGSASMHANKK